MIKAINSNNKCEKVGQSDPVCMFMSLENNGCSSVNYMCIVHKKERIAHAHFLATPWLATVKNLCFLVD